jgi:predicted MFS family arabinose efflux permease
MVVLALPLADLGAGGWRLVFLLSLVCVPLLWHAARHLPESDRFRRLAADAPSGEARRLQGSRLVLLGLMFFLLNLFVAPASQLQNDYLRTERGFSGALMTIFIVVTSTPGGLGVLVGGRWADTRGRRAALVPGLVAIGVCTALFFATAGPAMWAASLASSVLGGLAVASLGVLGPELFPTARRGGARGALTGIAVAGAVVGLLTAGWAVDRSGYGTTFALLAAGPVVGAALALLVPETRGRELEDLNRPDAPPGRAT